MYFLNYRFIGHVHANFENLRVTISVLKFSQIIQGLKFAKPLPVAEDNVIEEKLPPTLLVYITFLRSLYFDKFDFFCFIETS